MSEIQIALIAGGFTILGIFSGSILEFLREKWKSDRDKDNLQIEYKKTFFSPLYFFINDNFLVLEQHSSDPEILGTKICETYERNISSINELLKNNTHLMPFAMTNDITYYVKILGFDLTFFKQVRDVFKNVQEPMRTIFFNEKKAELLASVNGTNKRTTILGNAVHTYMTSSRYPPNILEQLKETSKKT